MKMSESAAPVRVTVRTGSASYSVEIASGLAPRMPAVLDAAGVPKRRVVVSSPAVWRLHADRFHALCSEPPILIPDGERFKNVSTVGKIYDAFVKARIDRGCAVLAVGGGVTGDVAGFAAATFLRGLPIVQVPTTLLAQVDSAIGGKVGVNHPLGKNLIGAFHQPAAVLIDPDVLDTLPRREFRAGLYEVVKYGVIASRSLFEMIDARLSALFARDKATLIPAIGESCRIKADVVAADEREAGPRRALNFGHTIGHALEAVTRYRRFRHGEAVAYGMLAAAELGVARGVMPATDREALAALIVKMGPLPAVADLDAATLVEAVARDKKVVAGKLHFVLSPGIGQTQFVSDVSEVELLSAARVIGLRG